MVGVNAYYKAMAFDYPLNFLKRIFGDNFNDPIPEDIDDTIIYILNMKTISTTNELKVRHKNILKYRYKKSLSLREVANKLGISIERLRQIDNKMIITIRAMCLDKKGLGYKLLHMGLSKYLANKEKDKKDILDTHISELNLNKRLYNGLIRAKKNTIRDIIEAGDELKRIRNIGPKSFADLNKIMKNLGLELAPDIYSTKDKGSIMVRSLNIKCTKYLESSGIRTVNDLIALSNTEIFNIYGINITAFIDIINELNKLGFNRDYTIDLRTSKHKP